MTIFFIIINLILNMIALLSIIILFLRQGKLFKIEDNQKKTINEMEDLLSSFVLEMKEDNEQLIKGIEDLKNVKNCSSQNNQNQPTSIKTPLEKTIESDMRDSDNDLSTRLEKTVGHYAVKAYQQQSKQEKVEHSSSFEGKRTAQKTRKFKLGSTRIFSRSNMEFERPGVFPRGNSSKIEEREDGN